MCGLRTSSLNITWDLLKIKMLRAHFRFQVALVVKNLSANAGDLRDVGLIPGSGRSPGESHEQRSLEGYIESIELQRVRHD